METKTDAKKGEDKGRDAGKKPLGPRRDSDLGKEPKKGSMKKSISRDKDEADGRSAERPKEEKLVRGLEKGRVRAVVDKKEAGKEGPAAPRKDEEKQRNVSRDKGKKGEQPEAASKTAVPEKAKGPRTGEDTRAEAQEPKGGRRDRAARPEEEKARKEEPREAKAPREDSKTPVPEKPTPGAPAKPADGPAKAEPERCPRGSLPPPPCRSPCW